MVTVNWMTGKSKDQKTKLAEAITEAMSEVIDSPPEATQVLFNELPLESWAIGGVLYSDREK
ncbi:MAG: 4-oxalocrotonate tautomerase family protein [SAR202 cluster bacterium]|nr:4-oxalocrotonate tautomerase family protein [SAR202 cluster bacterium]